MIPCHSFDRRRSKSGSTTSIANSWLMKDYPDGLLSRKPFSVVAKEASLPWKGVDHTVATGMGRARISFADQKRIEQLYIATGAKHLFPAARTILDTGAGGCRAIKLDDRGNH